ncbi:hypothetical protein TNCV_3098951 [Trichonephila clavipes]|nr:hypothetical protein TNCV_3098951 [Trichonephila clavipes]
MRCPEGTFGQGCQYQCPCQNKGTCDPVTGQCTCPPGFEGRYCENECQVMHSFLPEFSQEFQIHTYYRNLLPTLYEIRSTWLPIQHVVGLIIRLRKSI